MGHFGWQLDFQVAVATGSTNLYITFDFTRQFNGVLVRDECIGFSV
jgi:hypothetical protein